MPRPFLKTDIVMLAEHAGDFALKEDLAGLREVEAELRFRKTERARKLLVEVLTWAQELERKQWQARVLELEGQLGESEAQVSAHAGNGHAGPEASLYRQVGLHPECPDFVLAAARRAYRKAHHPDGRALEETADAARRFQEVDAIFDRLEKQRKAKTETAND
jgi:hypothetical protein